MALALSSALLVLQRSFNQLDQARNLTTATQILQTEVEKLRMRNWSTVSGYAAGPTTIPLHSVFAASTSIANRFSITRTVSTPQTDMREVVFTVSWRAYDGRTLTRSMTTHYSRYGLFDFFYNNSGT